MKLFTKLVAAAALLSMSLPSFADPMEVRILRAKNSSFQHAKLIALDIFPEIAKKYGYDIVVKPMEIPNSGVANDLLINKKLDIAITSLNGYGNVQAVDPGMKIFTGFMTYEPWLMCQMNVDKVSDLPPISKIAMKNLRATQQIMLRQIAHLETGDYNAYDDKIAVIPDAQAKQLMQAKDEVIQCHCCKAPDQNQLKRAGMHKVYNAGTNGLYPVFIVSYGRGDFFDEHPKLGEAWIETVQKAINIYNKDKLAAVKNWINTDKLDLVADDVIRDNEENNQTMNAAIKDHAEYLTLIRGLGMAKGEAVTPADVYWRPELSRTAFADGVAGTEMKLSFQQKESAATPTVPSNVVPVAVEKSVAKPKTLLEMLGW